MDSVTDVPAIDLLLLAINRASNYICCQPITSVTSRLLLVIFTTPGLELHNTTKPSPHITSRSAQLVSAYPFFGFLSGVNKLHLTS
jgi:hypothetical protein